MQPSSRPDSAQPPPWELTGATERLRLVDVGGQGGLQPEWHGVRDQIYPVLFEPQPEAAARLREQMGDAKQGLVAESALSNVIGSREIFITRNSLCVSLHAPNQDFLHGYDVQPHFEVIRREEVFCTRYDTLYNQGLVPAPDAIKIDVQGHEYEVLLGFGSLLQTCLGIVLEASFYELYREQRLLAEIVRLLDSFGLVLRKIEPQPNFGGDFVEVNAFFTTRRKAVAEMSTLQRRKFNLISTVWGIPHYAP